MENTAEMTQPDSNPRKNRGFWGWTVIIIRWLFILFFAVILLGGLYFKAPWKILTLDAGLLALLTIVPKKKRKYGWLALGIAVLAVAVWIFIPEKDSGDWKPYTFDEEFAALEAERMVPPEVDAAPLYEDLFERWKYIEENDPFPEEGDDDCVTQSRPWTAEEFPEVAAWFERHGDFFDDLITATQKPACYFPAAVTSFGLSESMEKLSPVKHFAQHLIRSSYYDIGENNNILGVYGKQVALYGLGRHMNQQSMMIDMLVGVAIEAMAHDALKKTLIQQPFPENIMIGDFLAMTTPIRTSYFDYQEKMKQILAYEKLLAKNTFVKYLEINPEGKIRYTRSQSYMNYIQGVCPDKEFAELSDSYWRSVSWKFSRLFYWLYGQPNDPMVLSGWTDEAYARLEEALQNQNGSSEADAGLFIPFELNYEYMIKSIAPTLLPSFRKIQGDIIPRVHTQKLGAEIVFDLVLYKKQHGQYPDTLDKLWSSEADKKVAELCAGFIYEKTDDSFKLYHVGQNGVDEKGQYKLSEYDPNKGVFGGLLNMRPEQDDILIWPDELEDDN